MKAKLKGLIEKGTVAVPGAYDAIVAKLIEEAGFEAVYVSGAGLSNSSGLPDTGILKREDVARMSSFIIDAVDVPVIVDADTGFGGPIEAGKTARAFEAIGASAIQIEDQLWPKRCGHLAGKTLVSKETFVKKIRAAVRVRRSRDFLIIARTDAASVEGLEGAIQRAKAYIEAGADVIFPEALKGVHEFRAFSREVGGVRGAKLMANMTEFGKTPYLSVKDFSRLGYSIVIFPMTCFRISAFAVGEALKELKSKGTQAGMLGKMQTRKALYKLLKYEV